MPWRLPDDLKRFKQLTLDQPVLMGRRTAESIGRALPGRRNLVLTRGDHAPFPGQVVVREFAQALDIAAGATLFVIGGAEIYALALPRADVLHLTWVDTIVEDADTFFPTFDPAHWRETASESRAADERHAHAFRFADYRRVSS